MKHLDKPSAFIVIACVVIMLLCTVSLVFLSRSEPTVPEQMNPIAVNTSEVTAVSLYWQDIFSGHERSADLIGAELEAFCALWNETWICHLEPFDTVENVRLCQRQGEIWSQVTFTYRDQRSETYYIVEPYIRDEADRWYFHTGIHLLHDISLLLNPDTRERDS